MNFSKLLIDPVFLNFGPHLNILLRVEILEQLSESFLLFSLFLSILLLFNLHHIQLINEVLFPDPEGMCLQICLPPILTHKEGPKIIHIHLVNHGLLLVVKLVVCALLLVLDLLGVLDILFEVIKLQILEELVRLVRLVGT